MSSLPYLISVKVEQTVKEEKAFFEDSISALKAFNEVGYGKDDSHLKLDLVYNPSGAFLPAGQATLEAEFKRQLKRKYDIVFNNLLVITNLPISRFLDYLVESNNYEVYMQKLIDAF